LPNDKPGGKALARNTGSKICAGLKPIARFGPGDRSANATTSATLTPKALTSKTPDTVAGILETATADIAALIGYAPEQIQLELRVVA